MSSGTLKLAPAPLALIFLPSPLFLSARLTQHSDDGLCGPHWHREYGAGVFPLVQQGRIVDADGQLVGRRLLQLDPQIS